jgi:hypothetical protein
MLEYILFQPLSVSKFLGPLYYEVAHESVKASNHHLAAWFRTGAVALIAFDAYTDVQYGSLASGFWGQVAFAGVTAFIVAFFGVIGFRLLEHGITEWSR